METEWFYTPDGNTRTPITLANLQQKLRSGELQPDSLVWTKGMEDWVMAKEHHELATIFENDTPPPLPTTGGQATDDPWHIETEPCPKCGHKCSVVAWVCPCCLKTLRKLDEQFITKI